MMEEIDRFQVPAVRAEMQPLDPTAASISDRDCDTRDGETVAMNYKPSPLQVKLEKQRELARKGSLKNGNMGSPVNQQPKKNNVMARTRLVVPNKGYSSLDQSPDEKPLVALDTDSDDDFDMSRYSSSGYSSAEGLTMPRVENQVDQVHLEKMVKKAVEEYTYKNSIEPTAYRPYKYWVTREEERYNPVFLADDRYATWRTGPYNSATWNKYTTYLPRIPRDAGMETILRGMPMQYPPKPDRLNAYEREVVVNMLNSLSRKQLPYIQHRYTIPGRMPYQGYYSPCTGRHYCLRGMDYYVDGAPTNEQQISQLVQKIEFPVLRREPRDDPMRTHARPAAFFPIYEP